MEDTNLTTQVILIIGLALYPIIGFFSAALLNALSGRKLEDDQDLMISAIICWPFSWVIYLGLSIAIPALARLNEGRSPTDSIWLRTSRHIEYKLGLTKRNERDEDAYD